MKNRKDQINFGLQKLSVPKSKFKQLSKKQNIQHQENLSKSSLGQILDDQQKENYQKIQNESFVKNTDLNFQKVKISSIQKSFQVQNELVNIKEILRPDLKQNKNRDSLEMHASLQPQSLKVELMAKINYRQKNISHTRAKSQYRHSKHRTNTSKKYSTYKDKIQSESQGQSSRSIISRKIIQKNQKKKVRLRQSSTNNFSQSQQVLKYKKCIPLEGYQIQEDELFMENTYRLRKDQMKIWKENQSQQKHASKEKKITSIAAKDNKKIINQAYDYDGLLLPNQTHNIKPKKHFVQPEISIKSQQNVQILGNYHGRYPRFGRTSTKIKPKKQPHEIDDELSPFAKNFQRIKWNTQIKTTPHSPREQDTNTKSKKILQSKKDLQSKQKRAKTLLHTRSHSAMENAILKQRLQKQRQKEDLMEQFQRIRTVQQSQSDKVNFKFGFSKYIKVKKFQEKQHKSKSYNSHTTKFIRFTNPFQEEDSIKLKHALKKGSEKIRANKKLFKKVFNVSMKYLQPQLRQDPPTLQCLKEAMQNQESERNKKSPKQKNKFSRQRNSFARLERQTSIQKMFLKNNKKDTLQNDEVNQQKEGYENIISQNIQKNRHPMKLNTFSKFSLNQSSKKLTKHGKHMLSRQSFNFVQKQTRFKNAQEQN